MQRFREPVLLNIVLFTAINAIGLVTIGSAGYLSYLTFFASNVIATAILFKPEFTKTWFKVPKKAYWLPILLIVSLIAGVILANLVKWLGFHSVGNPITKEGSYILILLPFMLLGEELFSISCYEAFKTKLPSVAASLLSAVVFGLIHYTTYFNGSIILTIVQVILLQGSARFIFNYAYEKTGSIFGSWLVHLLMDLVLLGLAFLVL